MKGKDLIGRLKKGAAYATLIAGTYLLYGSKDDPDIIQPQLIDINYNASIGNIGGATRHALKDNVVIDTRDIVQRNYSGFLKDSHKGDYFFRLEPEGGIEKKINNGCLELDMVLLGDFSKSVNGFQDFVADAFEAFVNRFELSDNGIRIGIVAFHTYSFIENEITADGTQLQNTITSLRTFDYGNSTDIADGLLTAASLLYNSDRDVTKMIIIVSDGSPVGRSIGFHGMIEDSGMYAKKQALKVAEGLKSGKLSDKENKITICGILVESSNQNPEFMMQISDPECYVHTFYENLAIDLERLDLCF